MTAILLLLLIIIIITIIIIIIWPPQADCNYKLLTSYVEPEVRPVHRHAAYGASVDQTDQLHLEVVRTRQGLVGGDDDVRQHAAQSGTKRPLDSCQWLTE